MKSSVVIVSKEILQPFKSLKKAPCLSLYMPTHRSHPDNLQDRILFKQLSRQLADSLYVKKYSTNGVKRLLLPFDTLLQNIDFWNHTTGGIAVFCSKDFFEIVNLRIPPDALAVVANRYHTNPLDIISSDDVQS